MRESISGGEQRSNVSEEKVHDLSDTSAGKS